MQPTTPGIEGEGTPLTARWSSDPGRALRALEGVGAARQETLPLPRALVYKPLVGIGTYYDY